MSGYSSICNHCNNSIYSTVHCTVYNFCRNVLLDSVTFVDLNVFLKDLSQRHLSLLSPVFLNYSNPEIFFKVRKFYFEQFSEKFWYTFGGLPNITVIYI